jgi:ribosome maturation factor RimP
VGEAGTEGALAARSDAIAVTVTGLGYDLVEVERLPRGLLRVTIDRVPGRVYGTPGAPDTGEFITVDDCERVTRQLQLALEVAGLAYERLEVSSPGLDRLLKSDDHCRRFAGAEVGLTLKLPFQGRKHWKGVLAVVEPGRADAAAERGDDTQWRLLVVDGQTESALDFRLSEARELRLVPVIDFKGRRQRGAPNEEGAAAPAADATLHGDQDR